MTVTGKRVAVSVQRLTPLDWQLYLVDHGSSEGARLVDLALGSIALYSCLLMGMAVFLSVLFRRFRRDLDAAFAQIKTLKGIIPICASCKKIRDDDGYWNHLESYLSEHADANLSHGICPDCLAELYPDFDPKDGT